MSKISLVHLILCLVFWDIYCKDEFDIQSKYDACDCNTVEDGNYDSYEEFYISSEKASLFCCAKNFLTGIDFNVSWTFGRSSYPDYEPSFFRNKQSCYGQIITSTEMSLLDSGDYNCTVRGKDGSSYGKTITLVIHDSGSFRGKPMIHNSSGNVYTEIGRSVKLNCYFFMKNSSNYPTIFWRKTFINETTYLEVIARDLPGVTQSPLNERDGYFSSELILKRITEEHIGNYSCQMVTWSDVVYQNISIFNQEHPEKAIERKHVVLSTCVFITISVLFIVSCMVCRWRTDISLQWRKYNYGNSGLSLEEFSHDIFVISGPSTVDWVQTVLLNKLEGVWFYNCYVPDRDMVAGQEYSKAICEKLSQSQRTIIIVTDCLLRSGWCNYMMNQAVINTLANSNKVLAITLSDISPISNYSNEAQSMIRVLKYIKKIKCPLDLRPHPKTMTEYCEDEKFDFPLIKLSVDDKVTKGQDQEEAPKDSKDKQEVPEQCLLSTHSIPNLPYSKSSSQLTVPTLHPSSSLSDLEGKKDMAVDWKISKKDQSQRIVNMISGSSEFIESGSRWKSPEEAMDRKKTVQSHQSYKHSYIFDYEIPFPKCVRKKLYSESSECPLSPCSNTPFFGDDGTTDWNRRRSKTFREKFGNFFFGNPKDLFWKKLRLCLPTQPLKLRPVKLQQHE